MCNTLVCFHAGVIPRIQVRLVCIHSFKIFIYTFSLFVLYIFLFLPVPVQGMNTCTVQVKQGPEEGRDNQTCPSYHSKVWDQQMEPVRPWKVAVTTEIFSLKKRHEKNFTLSIKPGQVKCMGGVLLRICISLEFYFLIPAWFDQSSDSPFRLQTGSVGSAPDQEDSRGFCNIQ